VRVSRMRASASSRGQGCLWMLELPADADRDQLERLALDSEVAGRWLEGRAPSRVIVVPGKLVNLVP
ncbi:MAG: hypothetical protein ACKOPN_10155, partial [Prochlorococcaceae cyanobacterium]